MNTLKIFLILFIWVVSSGFSWDFFKGKKKEVPQQETLQSPYQTFSNPKYGFSMKYPAKWFEGNRTNSSIAFLYLANQANNPISNLNVQVIPVTLQNTNMTQEAVNLVAQQLIDQIMAADGSKIEQDQWIKSNSYRGRELIFEYLYKGKTLKQRQWITFNKNKVYAIIYTAEIGVYQDYLGDYNVAIESLNFF